MERIWVVGSAGAGKSTLARALSQRLGLPHTELDRLYWRPGWQMAPTDEFLAAVDAVTSTRRWVICGNYRSAGANVLLHADTVVWLDYPLYVSFPRLLRRTVRRARTRDNLWDSGNYESWRRAFFSRESVLLYTLRTFRRRRADFSAMMQVDSARGRSWLRFTSPSATARWLESVSQTAPAATA